MTADQRILVGTAATLRWQPVDADGTAADPGAAVTITVTRADGTAVVTGATTSGSTSGERTYSLAAADNTLLNLLDVSWLVGGTARAATTVEVVGGYWASVAQIRASDETLANASKYPDAEIIRARWETEAEFEDVLGYACVPRYQRGRYDGTGTGTLPVDVAEVRTVRTARTYSDATTYTAFTAGELAALVARASGDVDEVLRVDGNTWTAGTANLVLEIEHGLDRPPADLLRAFYMRVLKRINFNRGGALAPSVALQAADGVVTRYARPGMYGALTDNDTINEVLSRRRRAGVG
jgi:hypothetical protein